MRVDIFGVLGALEVPIVRSSAVMQLTFISGGMPELELTDTDTPVVELLELDEADEDEPVSEPPAPSTPPLLQPPPIAAIETPATKNPKKCFDLMTPPRVAGRRRDTN
jgi:hypothetical protein